MDADERTELIRDSSSHRSTFWRETLSNHLSSSVSARSSHFPLILQCYISGFADAISYSCTRTWVAFMTGNLTQLSISVSTMLLSASSEEIVPAHRRIRMSSFSILGFVLGCLVSSGLSSRFGNKTRGKLVFSSILRTFITCWVLFQGLGNEESNLKNSPLSLGLLSLTMGWQAVSALKLPSTPYSSTVVFTTSLSQLASDPFFPLVGKQGRQRAISIFALLLGGFSSQSIMLLTRRLELDSIDQEISMALAALAGLEILLSLAWFFTENEETDEDEVEQVFNHH